MNLLHRKQEALRITGFRHAKFQDHIRGGLMVTPVKIGRNSAWPELELDAINRARIAGKSEDEIRALVRRLIDARKALA